MEENTNIFLIVYLKDFSQTTFEVLENFAKRLENAKQKGNMPDEFNIPAGEIHFAFCIGHRENALSLRGCNNFRLFKEHLIKKNGNLEYIFILKQSYHSINFQTIIQFYSSSFSKQTYSYVHSKIVEIKAEESINLDETEENLKVLPYFFNVTYFNFLIRLNSLSIPCWSKVLCIIEKIKMHFKKLNHHINIVYRLKELRLDYKQLLPFFLQFSQFGKNKVSLGINASEISEKEFNNLSYSLGDFLWKWATAKKDVASSQINRNDYKATVFQLYLLFQNKLHSLPPIDKTKILHEFSSLIPINKHNYIEIFSTPLHGLIFHKLKKKNGSATIHIAFDFEDLLHEEALEAHISQLSISESKNILLKKVLFFLRSIIYTGNEANGRRSQEILFKLFKKHLFDSPLVNSYIFSILMGKLMLEKGGTQSYKTKSWQNSIQKFNSNEIENILVLSQRYASGLKELVENVVFHTSSPQADPNVPNGYFFLRTHRITNMSFSFSAHSINKGVLDALKENDYILVTTESRGKHYRFRSFVTRKLLEELLGKESSNIISLYEKNKTDKFELFNSTFQSGNFASARQEYIRQLLQEKMLPEFFLELIVMDANHIGVLDNFVKESIKKYKVIKQSEPETWENILKLLKNLKIEDFYFGNYSNFPDFSKSHLDWRYIAQLGLKFFTKIIDKNYGYFEMETNFSDIIRSQISKKIISNKSKKVKVISDGHINGTHYNIYLPITHRIETNGKENLFIEKDSYFSVFSKWLKNINSIPDPIPINYDGMSNYNNFISDNPDLPMSKKAYLDGISKDIKLQEGKFLTIDYKKIIKKIIHSELVFKLMAKLQLDDCGNLKHIVVYNLEEKDIDLIETAFRVLAQTDLFWNKDSFLYLYNTNGIPLVVNGEIVEYCNKLNEYIYRHYGTCYEIKAKSSLSQLNTSIVRNNFIYPLEVLVHDSDNIGCKTTLFEKGFSTVLETPIESDKFGVKIPDCHMRLGSKIHINHFYEAEEIFQNSFFVDRFAFLIAKDIILAKREAYRRKSTLVLLGYGNYSELLLNRTLKMLRSTDNIGYYRYYFICQDVEGLKWSGNFSDDELSEDYLFALIVPVGSSLTTNYKVLRSWEKKFSYIPNFYSKDKVIFNTAIVTVRDKYQKELTNKEKLYFDWYSINYREKYIDTKYLEHIKFYVLKAANWNDPLTCPKCFPNGNFSREEIILETNKVSVIPQTILGWPEIDADEVIQIENLKRVKKLQPFVWFKHIVRDQNHFLYYINTTAFLEEEEESVALWLKSIKRNVFDCNDDIFNIIVAPIHWTNIKFVDMVYDIVFDGAAKIIRFDFLQKFRENLIINYLHFKNIKGIKFHFVDDAIITGETIQVAKSYVRSLFEKIQFQHRIKIFSSVIVLVDRLSKFRTQDLIRSDNDQNSKIFSYIKLFVPPIRDSNNFCYLCKSQKEYKRLIKLSLLSRIKKEFNDKFKALQPVIINSLTNSASPEKILKSTEHYKRLEMTHNLYRELATSNTKRDDTTWDSSFEKILREKKRISNRFWEKFSDISDKIDLIKIFTSPYLSYFRNIPNLIFADLLKEMDSLLSGSTCCNINEFNYMILLMKQLTDLKSNYIIRKENMKRIWRFYSRFKIKWSTLFEWGSLEYSAEEIVENIKLWQLQKESSTLLIRNSDIRKSPLFMERGRNINLHIEKKEDGLKKKRKLLMNVPQQLKEILIYTYEAYGEKRILKTICNIGNFKYIYVRLIKKLIHNDESKSLWLEFLLKTGEEYNVQQFPLNLGRREEVYFNRLNESHRGTLSEEILANVDLSLMNKVVDFIDLLFIENARVHQVALIYFVNELNKNLCECCLEKALDKESANTCPLPKNFLDDFGNIRKEIETQIEKEYYYEHYRMLAGTNVNTSHCHKQMMAVLKLRIYTLSNICNRFESNQSIEDKMNYITEMIAEVMEADQAFFSIRHIRYTAGNPGLYVIGKYNCSVNFPEFKLDDDYFTYRTFYDKNPETEWYTYFLGFESEKSKKNSKEKEISEGIKDICTVKFYHTQLTDRAEDAGLSSITCLYNNPITKERVKENVRYLLLVGNEIKHFLLRNFDNDNFSNLIFNKLEVIEYEDLISKIRHGAEKFIDTQLICMEKKIISMGSNIDFDTYFILSKLIESNLKVGTIYLKIKTREKWSALIRNDLSREVHYIDVISKIKKSAPYYRYFIEKSKDILGKESHQGTFKFSNNVVNCTIKKNLLSYNVIDWMIYEILYNAIKGSRDNFAFHLILEQSSECGEKIKIIFQNGPVSNPLKVQRMVEILLSKKGQFTDEAFTGTKVISEGLFVVIKIISELLSPDEISFAYNEKDKTFSLIWEVFDE